MAVGKRLRFEVLKRDGFRCVYCGRTGTDAQLHVDHRVPVADGGDDSPENLVSACIDCNLGKSDVPLDASRLDAVAKLAELADRRLRPENTATFYRTDDVTFVPRDILEKTRTRWAARSRRVKGKRRRISPLMEAMRWVQDVPVAPNAPAERFIFGVRCIVKAGRPPLDEMSVGAR